MFKVQDAYLIADAALLRIGCTTDPRHSLWSLKELWWSALLESIRKDGIWKICFNSALKFETLMCSTTLHKMIHDLNAGSHAFIEVMNVFLMAKHQMGEIEPKHLIRRYWSNATGDQRPTQTRRHHSFPTNTGVHCRCSTDSQTTSTTTWD